MKEMERTMRQNLTAVEESTTRLSSVFLAATFGMVLLNILLAVYTAVANKIGKPEFLGSILYMIVGAGVTVLVGAAYIRFIN